MDSKGAGHHREVPCLDDAKRVSGQSAILGRRGMAS